MKAVIYEQYGAPEVLHIVDVPKPIPERGEVLIRVHAATVTTGDVNMRGFTFVPSGFSLLARLMFGIRKPRKQVLGTETAGQVVAVGENVREFKVGDSVFGIDSSTVGGYAEYICRSVDSPLALKPNNLSYEEAAALSFGAGTALFFLRNKANVAPGQKVLVIGASGGTGSAAVQIAKYFGAQVTGICSTRNVELVRSLGADHVIDYIQQDFNSYDDTYDVIFDAVPDAYSFAQINPLLADNGTYLAVAGGLRTMLASALPLPSRGDKQIVAGAANENAEDLVFLAGLAAEGALKIVIDRSFPLEEITEAHRYVDEGHKRGNVVITIFDR